VCARPDLTSLRPSRSLSPGPLTAAVGTEATSRPTRREDDRAAQRLARSRRPHLAQPLDLGPTTALPLQAPVAPLDPSEAATRSLSPIPHEAEADAAVDADASHVSPMLADSGRDDANHGRCHRRRRADVVSGGNGKDGRGVSWGALEKTGHPSRRCQAIERLHVQVVDALASGLTELLLDHVEVVRTPDHCDPLLGAEVEPGRIRGLDLGRNHRLHRPTGRFEKMSVWTEPSVRTLRRVGVGPPCGAGWATPRPRSRRR
jgi:hypothetical protein